MTGRRKFSQYQTALEMRDAIRRISRKVINEERPRPRYGNLVEAADPVTNTAVVRFPGDPQTVTVRCGLVAPQTIGCTVRVERIGNERYLTDAYGCDEVKMSALALVGDLDVAGIIIGGGGTGGSGEPADSDLATIAAINSSSTGVLATDGSGWLLQAYTTLRARLGLGTAALEDVVSAGSIGVLDAQDPSTTDSRTPTAHAASHKVGGADYLHLSLPTQAWAASTTLLAGVATVLPTGGLGYVSAAYTTRAAWDATERAAWTFLPGGHYERFTANGSWVVPNGISQCTYRVVGGGAGGSGGGSALTSGGVSAQTGGAGGGAGAEIRGGVTGLTPGTSETVTVGAGGTAGAGAAANGNAGLAGGQGGASSVVLAGTTFTAQGGTPGTGGPANGTGTTFGGLYGMGGSGTNYSSSTTPFPGQGGVALTNTSGFCSPNGSVTGGTGGAPASATLGGSGGAVAAGPGLPVYQLTTKTANTSGGTGANAIAPGHGGAGGGGGAPGGAGGTGGTGAAGRVELWY